MTDLDKANDMNASSATPSKRDRLVAAACEVFHHQGIEKTTLSDVAQSAGVPVGTIYYYFKTKDDLINAAIDAHADTLAANITLLDRHRTPKARLKALVRSWIDERDLAARYGCPFGTLCSEIEKRTDGIDRHAATVMAAFIDWAEQQFTQLGRRDARDLAVALIAAYQGISLLTNTLRDPELMTKEGHRLQRWIDTLA